MNLTEFVRKYRADDNEWWLLSSGDHQVLFDELLELLLVAYSDEDPCSLDHHGYCQTHFLSEDCPIPAIRKVQAAADDGDEVGRANGRAAWIQRIVQWRDRGYAEDNLKYIMDLFDITEVDLTSVR